MTACPLFILVIEADSPEKVDKLSFELPIMKEMGDQVQIEVTPIMPYHAFANFLYGSVGEEKAAKTHDASIDPTKEGIFYWLIFNVEYAGEFYAQQNQRIWCGFNLPYYLLVSVP